MLLQSEMDVRAEVVHPYFLCLRLCACRTLVEENDICLDARLVKNARRQPEDRVQVCRLKQLPADDLTSPALKKHIVRYYHSRLAGGLQNRVDMLHKVQLLVGTGGPEVRTVVDQVFLLLLPLLICEGQRRFFPKGRISCHIIHAISGVRQQGIRVLYRHFPVDIPDVV